MTRRALPSEMATKLIGAAREFTGGFEDVRMDDIAAAAGIPRATLYYHFAGKDDVLAFVLRMMLDDLRISLMSAVDLERDTAARLRAVVRAHLTHLAANPVASQLLLLNLGRSGQLREIAAGIDAAFHATVRQVLADAVASGEVEDIDIEVVATGIFGAVTFVGLQTLVLAREIDVDATVERLLPMFWSGIAMRRTSKRARR